MLKALWGQYKLTLSLYLHINKFTHFKYALAWIYSSNVFFSVTEVTECKWMQRFQIKEHYFAQKIQLNSCISLDTRKTSQKKKEYMKISIEINFSALEVHREPNRPQGFWQKMASFSTSPAVVSWFSLSHCYFFAPLAHEDMSAEIHWVCCCSRTDWPKGI